MSGEGLKPKFIVVVSQLQEQEYDLIFFTFDIKSPVYPQKDLWMKTESNPDLTKEFLETNFPGVPVEWICPK